MIPNFNPNKWDMEKIIDYVIGEQPLTDQQIAFLNYFDKLQKENKNLMEINEEHRKLNGELRMENKKLKEYCCKRNDCSGRLKENNKLTDSEVLNKFEKWIIDLQKYIESKQTDTIYQELRKKYLLDLLNNILNKLQELKEGKK